MESQDFDLSEEYKAELGRRKPLQAGADFLQVMQHVEKLDTLDPISINIKCWSYESRRFEDITVDNIYPFMTLNDIKLGLYEVKKDTNWIPKFVFLGTVFGPVSEGPKDKFKSVDFQWENVEQHEMIYLNSPLKLTNPQSQVDANFVDGLGQPKDNDLIKRSNLTIEDVFFAVNPELPTLYAFCLDDLLLNFGVAEDTVPTATNWYGRFYMYFPAIDDYNNIRPTNNDIKDADLLLSYKKANTVIFDNVEELIQSDLKTATLTVDNILALKLHFDYLKRYQENDNIHDQDNTSNIIPFTSVEDLFFELDVNNRRPFIRFLPIANEPITKLHTTGIIPIPDIRDPALIFQWRGIENPDDFGDFMFIKVLTKDIEGGGLPLYSTIEIFNDGGATFIALPSKQHRRGLDPVSDLQNLDKIIFEAVQGSHLQGKDLILDEISLTLSLKFDTKQKPLTKSILQKRVKYFASFIQEIPIYQTDLPYPLILLRYKTVSDFKTENNIFTFIRQIIPQYPNLSARFVPPDFISAIASEFKITHTAAINHYYQFREQAESFQLVAPEIGTFVQNKNSGIDIMIYNKFPIYYIRISRCNSIYHLKRIYTILSLLLNVDISPSSNPEAEEKINTLEPIINQIVTRQNAAIDEKTTKKKQLEEELYVDDFDQSDDAEEAKAEKVDSGQQFEFDELDFFGGGPVDQHGGQRGGAKPKPPPRDEDPNLRAKSYYLIQLNKADPRLFDFKPPHKDQLIYSRKCQVETHKQPIVLNQKEYDRMKKEYSDDEDFHIIEFPLPADSPEPTITPNTLTVMKYGTDATKPNYYMCPKLFCLADRIPIKESEFIGTQWRSNYQHDYKKEPRTCPFCGGKPIVNPDIGLLGYTVLERGTLKKSDTVPTDIAFVKETSHPEDFELPCCVAKTKSFFINEKPFAHFMRLEQRVAAVTRANGAAAALPAIVEEENEDYGEDLINYGMIQAQLERKYILTADKHPLPYGKFALCSPGLDSYFGQNSSTFVKRVISQKISKVKGINGFLRMGTQFNMKLNDPNRFFGILAPYIHKNTIDEVRERCHQVFTPIIFLNANYGNLVLEFYDPCKPRPEFEELSTWMNKYFDTVLTENNKYECERLYMSYANFMNYIDSKNTVKEYRVFAQTMAYKNLFTENGLILIVLEYDSQNLDKEPTVICPPFGYNPEIHHGCDFGFVLRDESGLYESLFFFENVEATKTLPASILTFMRFNPESKYGDIITSTNPKTNIVKRIQEFTSKCQYVGRAIYTASSIVKTQDLITLSQLITLPIKKYIHSIVRDIYNHIVGVNFLIGSSSRLIPLPVADDGYIAKDYKTYFDWVNTPITTADKIVAFYNEYINDIVSRFDGYKIDAILKKDDVKTVSSIRLKNGAIIPAKGYFENLSPELQSIVKNMNAVPEYTLNRNLIVSSRDECKDSKEMSVATPEDLETITREQLEELYQHFRLSFASWLSDTSSSTLRKQIEKTIFPKQSLPLYEKRKRLSLLIYDELSKWFVETEDYIPEKPFIKRRDCLKITNPGKCTDACVWKESESLCRIHIPDKVSSGPIMILTKELFIKQLIDELILFRQKRQELLDKKVKSTVDLKTAIRVNDQWILPESSISWIELLKRDWTITAKEEPKFFEEVIAPKKSDVTIDGTIVTPEEEVDTLRPEGMYALDNELLEKLNIAGQKRNWSLYKLSSLAALLKSTQLSADELGLETNATVLSDDALRLIVQKQKIAIFIIKNTVESDDITYKLYLPESYREQRITPFARTYIQMDYLQDDGTFKSNTTLLVSNRNFKADILLTDLPDRLQTIYNNRLRMVTKGVVEFVKPQIQAAAVAPTQTLINENAPSVPLRISRRRTRALDK